MGKIFRVFSRRGSKPSVCNSFVSEEKKKWELESKRVYPFATDLTSLVIENNIYKNEGDKLNSSSAFGPPLILEKCIHELEARGMQKEGIYRVAGACSEVEKLKNLFEQDLFSPDLSQYDVYAIADVVKFFIRQLPEPLITNVAFRESFHVTSGDLSLKGIQILVNLLPRAHKITLRFLLEHCNQVAKEEVANKMSALNMAKILAPNIFYLGCCRDINALYLQTKLLTLMIVHVYDLQF